MKEIRFTLSGSCLVPDGAAESESLANHIRLISGQVISIQPVIEIASDADTDDYRDLSYDEAIALDLHLECEERRIELEDRTG